jgi:hypothetical protein
MRVRASELCEQQRSPLQLAFSFNLIKFNEPMCLGAAAAAAPPARGQPWPLRGRRADEPQVAQRQEFQESPLRAFCLMRARALPRRNNKFLQM